MPETSTVRKKRTRAEAKPVEDGVTETCVQCGRVRPVPALLFFNGKYRCPERWDCKHTE
jgi:hypothetical protein